MSKKIISVLVALTLVSAILPLNPVQGGTDAAVAYLKSKTASPWVTMALVAAGESAEVSYLKNFSGAKAIDYEAPILALAAAGENPRAFASEDFVQKLKSFYAAGQIGDAAALNDDIFGVLALMSAGEPVSDAVIQGSKNFILQNQNSDGGWPFAVGGTSDTNTTAMAIMAALETGLAKTDPVIAAAVQYLKGSQNSDGGWPYDPKGQWGTASDASSDAWVISAANRLGDNPRDWIRDGHNPVEHLLSLQSSGGFFEYQPGSAEDAFSPVTTAYAVIALEGKFYPVAPAAPAISQPQVGYKIEGSTGAVCAGEIAAADALELVKNAAAVCSFDYHIQETSFGPYLDRIGADAAAGSLGWLYAVNFETPAVGAATYQLASGDYVIWHFGDFSWQPEKAAELDLTVDLAGAPAGDGDDGGTGAISFSVSPTAGGQKVNFGLAAPGTIKPQNVTIANQSQGRIHIESAVTGDSIFKNYLKVAGASWRDFGINLQGGESKDTAVELSLPASFVGSGTKNGKLIFWAVSN